MRIASICAVSALALGFGHSHALAEMPPPSRPSMSQVDQARNTFIFKFDESVGRGEMSARAQEIVAAAGGTLRHVYTNVVGGFAATVPSIAVWNIGARRDIIAYERDEIVTIAAPPKWLTGGGVDCSSKSQQTPWGVNRILATSAASKGSGIHVYVIDTGIDLDHPDLQQNIGTSQNCIGGCKPGGDDDQGHGTHVAGTIGARSDNTIDVVGVAPAVTLHSVKVLGSNGSGYRSDIIAGISWIVGQVSQVGDVPVVANLSLGGSGSKTGTCTNGVFSGSDSYHQAFCEGAAAGVVFVVAAGNDGGDAEKMVPAAYDDAVITVSATHNKDDWPKWSNWGDNAASWGPDSAPVTIAAPGVDILSTQMCGGTTTKSGTSMASPHVAGVAAILIKSGTYATNYNAFVDIRRAIVDNAAASFKTSLKGYKPHDEKFVCAVAGKINCK